MNLTNRKVNYINITSQAKENLYKLIYENDLDPKPIGIRISLKTKGCNGLEYDLQYAYHFNEITNEGNVVKKDELIQLQLENKPEIINIFIDFKSSMYLIGVTLDFEQNDTDDGFKFVNPNEKGRCGCGESFTV